MARAEIDKSIYDPYSRAFIRDPFPTWNRLLEEYPVAWHRDMKTWVVTPHDLCHEALKTPRFSLRFQDWEYAPEMKPSANPDDFERAGVRNLGILGPEDHKRMRKLTVPAFSKQVMDQIELKIRDLVVECFDNIGTPKEIDVATQIAAKIPVPSISRMVGVPRDAEQFFEHGLAYNLVRANNPLYTEEERQAARKGTLPGYALLKDLIAERRHRTDPGDDFLGLLVSTTDNGDRLSDWDIIGLISALIVAGADTVTDIHTLGVLGMLNYPDQRKLLMDNPDLIEGAVLEILRHGAPGKTGPIPRYAVEDTELGGQEIKKGNAVMVAMAAAWNDPKKWPEPRRFDITRSQEGNIIFGAGPHFCIGLNLVKVQAKLMLQEFNRRFPDAEMGGEIDYDYDHFNARRMSHMPVRTNLH